MAESESPVPNKDGIKSPEQHQSEPGDKQGKAEPEFLQTWEAKLRSLPLWLVLLGALVFGLAAGGVWYLLRGLFSSIFANTP